MKILNIKNMIGLSLCTIPMLVNAEIAIPPANYFVLDDRCKAAQVKETAISIGTICTLTLRNGCPGPFGLGPKGTAVAYVSRKSRDGKSFLRVSPVLNMKACSASEKTEAKPLVIPFKVTTSGTYNFVNQRTGSNKGLVYFDFAVQTGDAGEIERVSKKVKLFVKASS